MSRRISATSVPVAIRSIERSDSHERSAASGCSRLPTPISRPGQEYESECDIRNDIVNSSGQDIARITAPVQTQCGSPARPPVPIAVGLRVPSGGPTGPQTKRLRDTPANQSGSSQPWRVRLPILPLFPLWRQSPAGGSSRADGSEPTR